MQDIQSPFGPGKGHGATPKTYVVTTSQQLFSVIQQWLSSSENAKTLKNLQEVTELMMARINELINQKMVGGGLQKGLFGPLPEALKQQLAQNFPLLWQNSKSITDTLQKLQDAVNEQNVDHAANLLAKLTGKQLDEQFFQIRATLQQTLNAALKPFLKGGMDESLLKLYFTDLADRIAQKYGHSLPEIKNAILERLQNQLLTTPEQATLFRDASVKMLKYLQTPEGEKMLVMLIGGELANQEREKVKSSLKAIAANPAAKQSLKEGVSQASELTDDSEIAAAKNEEITRLQGMVYVKQVIDPAFERQLASLKTILDILAKAFPNDPQVALLTTLLNKVSSDYQAGTINYADLAQIETSSLLSGLVNNLPNRDMRLSVLAQLFATLKDLKNIFASGDSAINDAIAQTQRTIDDYQRAAQRAQSSIDLLNSILNRLMAGGSGQINSWTAADWGTLNDAYSQLIGQQQYLTPEDQKIVANITNLLKSITATAPDGTKTNMFQLMAEQQVLAIIKKYATGPNSSIPPENMALIQKEISALIPDTKKHPEYQAYADALSKYVSMDTSSKGYLNNPFFTVQNGVIYFNTNMPGNAAFDNFPSSITQFQNAISGIPAQINAGMAKLNTQLAALLSSADQLEDVSGAISNAIDEALNDVQAKVFVWTNSLPDAFADVIINKFMPAQEARLWALANLLKFYNLNASSGNDLISAMRGWDLANMDFNCGLNSPVSCYTNEYNTVTARLQQINDPNSGLRKKIADGRANLDKALKDGDITQDQFNERSKYYDTLSSKLDTTEAALKDIQWRLEPASRNPPVGPTAYDLGAESAVKRSLTDFYGFVDGDATKNTSLGQQQQLTLQLTMTQIQQEWSIVTTCMTMLNQMYMTFARGISPH